MSEPTERPELHQPLLRRGGQHGGGAQQPEQAPSGDTNPWLGAMAGVGGLAAFIGVLVYAAGYDDATSTPLFGDADPTAGLAAMFAGQVMISGGVGMLVLWAAASAICWQLRRR